MAKNGGRYARMMRQHDKEAFLVEKPHNAASQQPQQKNISRVAHIVQ
jgi:hypothetical protein